MNKTLKISLIVVGAIAGIALLVGAGFAIGRSVGVNRTAVAARQFIREGITNRIQDYRDQRRMNPGMMGRQPIISGRNALPQNQQPDCQEGALCGPFGSAGVVSSDPLTLDAAQAAADEYLTRFNNTDLVIDEIMIFENNAYVVVKEVSTGKGAFELLVYPGASIAIPEFGPTRIWNTKYGMMGGRAGMMKWQAPQPDTATAAKIEAAEAVKLAQEYLNLNITGAVADETPIEFYGYYSVDYSIDGKPAGMLSINAVTGRIWLHTWHGTFISEWEAE